MAYMNQEKKKNIAAVLKTVMPKDWKYSLSVENHSAICLTIKSAPIDLIGEIDAFQLENNRIGDRRKVDSDRSYYRINEYHLDTQFEGKLLKTFQNIKGALNLNNHDNSDSMTDYFDVGHYINISIGSWNKPFIYIQ